MRTGPHDFEVGALAAKSSRCAIRSRGKLDFIWRDTMTVLLRFSPAPLARPDIAAEKAESLRHAVNEGSILNLAAAEGFALANNAPENASNLTGPSDTCLV